MIASFFYHYGANRNVKIFIGSDDLETRKEFSELCGQKKIKNFSVNTHMESSASSNTGATSVPLITTGMLERINGNEKGDAIVSVRGYEPLWTRFTPSYALKHIYFAEGKSEEGGRESILFEKEKYVFDISKGRNSIEEERILDAIEKEEEKWKEEELEKEEFIETLDKKWQETMKEVEEKLKLISILLNDNDSRVLEKTRLEHKAILLYSFVESYDQSIAHKIQDTADYLSNVALPKLAMLQHSAIK